MWLKTTYAHWFNHVNAVNAARPMKDWLSDAGSMTKKLKAHSADFRVRHVTQTMGGCGWEESQALGVALRTRVMQREVILLCDNQPVIYGHTSVLSDAMRRDWPFMAALGNIPLGEKLFTDQRIRRQPLQYARLHDSHPLMQRAASVLGLQQMPSALFARRSIFCRKDGAMLVTEIFLPAITDVMAIKSDI
jgi:chorismate--pyruvate lyase